MLSKIKILLGNRKFIFIACLVLIIFVSLAYGILSERTRIKKQAQEPLKPSPTASSEGLIPGKSKVADLEELGEPREIIENKDQTKSYLFGLKTDPEPLHINTKDDTVIFIQKRPTQEDPLRLKDLISEYGQPNLELFTQFTGLKAYVFLNSGVAAIAIPETGTITQLRYFIPSSQEEFLQTWGKDFQSAEPTLPPLYY